MSEGNEVVVFDPYNPPSSDHMVDDEVAANNTLIQFRSKYKARLYYATEMALAGVDWETIAEKVGYANGESAKYRVMAQARKNYLERNLEALTDLNLQRIERLILLAWGKAKHGDLKAIQTINALINTELKMLGVTEDRAKEVANQITHNTLVIGGNSDEFIAGLRKARGEELTA